MGILSNFMGFGRPGPGVRPDEPRKKGLLRWFEILGRDFGSFFKAGFLALLGFLPFMVLLWMALVSHAVIFVLAAGVVGGIIAMPQIVGLADTLLRSLRDEPGYWWVTYRRAWKRNVKACVAPGAICGLVLATQLFTIFHLQYSTDNLAVLLVALIVGVVLSVGLTLYIVPQIALIDLAFPRVLKNSILLYLGFLPRTAGAVAVQVVYWGAYLLFYPLSTLILPFTNFWLPMSLSMLILYLPLEKSFHIEENIKKMREEDLNARTAATGAWPPAAPAEPAEAVETAAPAETAETAEPAEPVDDDAPTPEDDAATADSDDSND